MKTLHIIITGRVQGVGFRYATQEQAKRLGLKGWVKNCRDGSVEVAAQGSDDAVDQLLAWAYRGPALAKLTEVKVLDDAPDIVYNDFSILR